MKKRGKQANYSNRYQITKLLLINLAATFISLFLCMLISALAGWKMDLDEMVLYYVTFPVIGVCAFANGFVMTRFIRVKGWLVGLCANILFFVVITISHFMIGGQEQEGLFLVKLIILLLCGTVGGIVGVNKKKRIK